MDSDYDYDYGDMDVKDIVEINSWSVYIRGGLLYPFF